MNGLEMMETGGVLGAAAMVQASVGFGFALFATPLLVWLGIPLQQVIVMVAIGSLMQSVFGVHRLHASIPWREAWMATALRLLWLLAGMVGMGGPPLVLWTMAHDWPPEKIRGFYFATFMTFIPIMVGLMCVLPWFGPLGASVLTGLAFAPAVYLGSRMGLAAGARLSRQRLYVLTCICLMATGISAMVSSAAGK